MCNFVAGSGAVETTADAQDGAEPGLLLKALDEAEALGRELSSAGDCNALSARIDELEVLTKRLEAEKGRPGVMAELQVARFMLVTIPLVEAPAMLRKLMQASA